MLLSAVIGFILKYYRLGRKKSTLVFDKIRAITSLENTIYIVEVVVLSAGRDIGINLERYSRRKLGHQTVNLVCFAVRLP